MAPKKSAASKSDAAAARGSASSASAGGAAAQADVPPQLPLIGGETLVTDARLESPSRKPIVKPGYLFGDFVDFDASTAYDGDYKWLRKVGDRNLFLPNMERMFPISYFQCASVPRHMDWPLVKNQDGVALGTLTFHGVRTVGYNRQDHIHDAPFAGSDRSDTNLIRVAMRAPFGRGITKRWVEKKTTKTQEQFSMVKENTFSRL
uniref:Uncharacterized protein n=1 Tax=Asparagus officinalis TaxID=4686 RepID=Q2A9Z0_ASPOF|nr:hypothetical protein 20.t00024 [Asparagus officinalis]